MHTWQGTTCHGDSGADKIPLWQRDKLPSLVEHHRAASTSQPQHRGELVPESPRRVPGDGWGARAGCGHQTELPPAKLPSFAGSREKHALGLSPAVTLAGDEPPEEGEMRSPASAAHPVGPHTFRMRSPSCKELPFAASPLSTMCLMKS